MSKDDKKAPVVDEATESLSSAQKDQVKKDRPVQEDVVDALSEEGHILDQEEGTSHKHIEVSTSNDSQEDKSSVAKPTKSEHKQSSEKKDKTEENKRGKKSEIFAFLSRQKEFITTLVFFLGALSFMYSTFATQKKLELMECLLRQHTEKNKEQMFQWERLHTAQMIENEVFILAKVHSTLTPHEAEVYALLQNIAKQENMKANEASDRLDEIFDELAACHA